MGKIILGKIVSTVGLKGELKCLLYSDEPTWLDKKITFVDRNQVERVLVAKKHPYCGKKNLCLCVSEGISDRKSAECAINCDFWIDRSEMENLPADEFYFVDIIGKEMFCGDECIGAVKHIHDFGAGLILESTGGEYIHIKEVESLDDEVIRVK